MSTDVLDRTRTPQTDRAQPAAIPFTRLVRGEWRKMITTRATRWVLLVVGLVMLGALAIPLTLPGDIDQTWAEYVSFASLGMSIVLPVVAILMITSEWTQRTALATFTQEPRRGRVLGAKITVGVLLALAASVVAFVLASAALWLSSSFGRDVTWELGAQVLVSLGGYNVLNLLMGMAIAALVHNSAASIVLYYLLGVVWGILGAIPAIEKVAQWLDPNRGLEWLQQGLYADRGAEIVVSLTVWIILPLVAGTVRSLRREVS